MPFLDLLWTRMGRVSLDCLLWRMLSIRLKEKHLKIFPVCEFAAYLCNVERTKDINDNK